MRFIATYKLSKRTNDGTTRVQHSETSPAARGPPAAASGGLPAAPTQNESARGLTPASMAR